MLKPLIPMLAITGKPTRAQIEAILEEYDSVHINQIMLYPRSGCELSYMSEEWFSVLEYFIEAGKTRAMKFWLYDEMNWPSGNCNGLVSQNTEYTLKALFKQGDKVVEICGNTSWEGRGCPDVLCPEAVELFICSTHERYKARLGKYFGSEILGFFTDEPSYIYEVWPKEKDFSQRIPYYRGMDEEFNAVTNGKKLKEEFLKANKNSTSFFYTVVTLLKERFKKVFLGRIRTWCEENNLLFTGHLLNESPLGLSVQTNGNLIEQLQTLSVPGMDDIWTRTSLDEIEWNTLGSVGCAIANNKQGGMAELFALGPCNMPFSSKMKMIALCAAYGIDRYYLAVAPIDLRGNVIKDKYFNPFTAVQPWFKGLKHLNEFASVAAAFAHKDFITDIEIVYPYAETAGLLGDKSCMDSISKEWAQFLKELVSEQISWKFVLEHSKSGAPCVAYSNGNWKELNSGQSFTCIDEIILWLNNNISRAVEVFDENGKKACEVFVKVTKEDDILIVDLKPKRTECLLRIKHKNTWYDTDVFGCLLSNVNALTNKLKREKYKMDVSLCYTESKQGIYRPFFGENVEKTFFSERGIEVDFQLRNFPNQLIVSLNGEELNGEGKGRFLPVGMAEFYVQAKGSLKKGNNVLTIKNGKDFPYLPAVILCGDFEPNVDKLLSRNNDFSNGKPFYGKMDVCFEYEFSEAENVFLLVENNDYYCELFIEDERIGESLKAPHYFVIPDRYKGKKASLKLKYYSSISSIMGELPIIFNGFDSAPDRLDAPLLSEIVLEENERDGR